MEIKDYERKLVYTLNKGLNYGLEVKDYYFWYDMLKILYENNTHYNSEYQIIIEAVEQLLKIINDSGILYKYSKKNVSYIKENALLLPLVLANNSDEKVKMFVDNSYMFTCPFHFDKKPSFSVTDMVNLAHCFGHNCGKSVNALSYIKEYEKISYTDSLEILAYIFLFDIKKNNPKFESLVLKYQKTILSDRYKAFLEMGYNRYIKRGSMNEEIDKMYQKRYQMIERIRNKEYDPDFVYEENSHIMKLTLVQIK